jgi:hypothetical protein
MTSGIIVYDACEFCEALESGVEASACLLLGRESAWCKQKPGFCQNPGFCLRLGRQLTNLASIHRTNSRYATKTGEGSGRGRGGICRPRSGYPAEACESRFGRDGRRES